ncbi:MAG TPA: YciC family protein [Gammaproteobacteria bacterium]
MYTKPESPQPIGGVLDSGFSLYRYSLKGTFVFAFLGALVSAPAGRIVQPTPGEPIDFALLAIVMCVSVALSLLLWTPVIAKIHAVQHGESLTAGEALAVSLRRFPVVLGVVVLLSLAVGLGFLLVIPGLYLAVKFVFAPIAAVTESKGVLDSFRYSSELVRGRWWRTAVLLTIVSVVALVLYMLVGVVAGLFVAIGGGVADIEQMQRLPWQIDFIVTPLFGGLLTPLFYSLLMAIYADCKLRNEGADIAERIAAAEA